MELWGGVECTVNRVGDSYRDQLVLTGHQDRLTDLALIAGLGARAIRLPVIWERVAPRSPEECDWQWSDERVAEVERLGMRPIIGLLHHGSGPADTSLVADNFVALFARYAAAAASRYPHVQDWTPINEPLTTARFSTLYGAWYPHAKDAGQFWLAVLNQAEATAAAMRAIRAVNPQARLVQTDDLGEAFADPELHGVADYYNHRRWLHWDLLAGKVTPGHPLWEEGERLGYADRLHALAAAPCPPNIIGVNHYPTSDRFLRATGSSADDRGDAPGFDDLAAVRLLEPPPGGLAAALRQAWQRYGIPLAITESHLGCTREEQLRWIRRSWDTALELKAEGVDVRALTAWALMGNVDWVNLITQPTGFYEPGAFDVRGPAPRPTAIARLLSDLGGRGGGDRSDLLQQLAAEPGWWERDIRLERAPGVPALPMPDPVSTGESRPILITGATGTLGQAFAGACRLRGLHYVLTDRATLPIHDAEAVERVLDEVDPWAVINAAGWVRVDDAEGDPAACFRANADGAAVLSVVCGRRGVHCTIISSDLVFGDDMTVPRHEQASTAPLNIYGQSKQAAERRSLAANPATLVIRTAAFFSPFDPHNFAMQVERALLEGRTVEASADHIVTPTYVPDLVRTVLDLVIDGESGLWHLTHEEPTSWLEFGRRIAEALDLDADRVVHAEPERLGWRARRPRHAALASSRGRLLPRLDEALAVHVAERQRERGAA